MSSPAARTDKARPDLTRLLARSAIAVIGASTNAKSISGQPPMHMIASLWSASIRFGGTGCAES